MTSLTQIKAKYDNMSGGVYADIEKLIKALELAVEQRDRALKDVESGECNNWSLDSFTWIREDNAAIESVLKGGEMKHELKIWPQYYCRVADGSKTFEVRDNDRGFQPGDDVILREFDPNLVIQNRYPGDQGHDGYTCNKPLRFKIGYVHPIDDKRVVFSLLPKELAREVGE